MKGSKKEYGPFEFLLMELGAHVRFLKEGEAKGIGIGVAKVIELINQGFSPDEAAKKIYEEQAAAAVH